VRALADPISEFCAVLSPSFGSNVVLTYVFRRFIEYVEPLVTAEELRTTVKVVEEFARVDGPSLDAQLRKLRDEAATSWLEGMWDTAYLEYRERTPINVNPAFMLENESGSSQLDRASRLLESCASFTVSLRNGSLEVDKEGASAICMHQYTKLFGAARIPSPGRDYLIQCHTSRHVVVLSKRQFYVIDILDASGNPIPAAKHFATLGSILADSDANSAPGMPTIPNVSALTSDHRDTWASIYPELESMNRETLTAINEAIILLILDPQSPATVDAAGSATLHNLGESRWFDKALQLIVYKNAVTGVNMEHAGFDGQTLIRWFGDIATASSKLPFLTPSASSSASPSTSPSFKKLKWELSDKVYVAMGRAQRDFEEFVCTMDLKTLVFKKFGKRAITKHQVSPDAFVQMAFHLAYFRTFGAVRSAYESCSMKRFYHGRTECLRSMTGPLHKFIGITQCPPATAAQQVELAKAAFAAHIARAKQCQLGNGVDRHLWGMLQLANHRRQHVANYKVPQLYSLPAWSRMRHDHLSTSNCGRDELSFFGFGPTWSDGLGIGYIIKKDEIIAAVTSFENTSPKFVAQLDRALEDILALFDNGTPIRTLQAKL